MMMLSKTALQDKAAALFGALLLASDVAGPCDGAPTVAEALEELAAFGRQHARFRLVEEHEGLFQRAYENLETRVAAEFESYIDGALPLPLRTFGSTACRVQEPLTQNVQIIQKALVFKELLHRWKSLGDSTEDRADGDCHISKGTFTFLTSAAGGRLGSALRFEFPCEHHASFHVDTVGYGSRSDDGPVGDFQVTVRLCRSQTQSR